VRWDESVKGNKKLEVVAYGCRGWDIWMQGKRRIKRRGDEISKHMMSRNGVGTME
jgi:hypothetical protein